MWRFLTGQPPETLAIAPEAKVVLDGKLSGLGLDNRDGNFATNLPLVGATVEVYATHAATGERLGPALHARDDRRRRPLGPVRRRRPARHEFVISAPGYAIDACLPLALPALVADREPAPGAPCRRRPRAQVAVTR